MIEISQMPYSTYYIGVPQKDYQERVPAIPMETELLSWVMANKQFSLSDDDMLTYYLELFRNRTTKDKTYIEKYNSLEELEEDIYGKCYYDCFIDMGLYKDFKEIYSTLDKYEFLHKMNTLIGQYGNAIVIGNRALCIKTDEDIRPYSFITSLCPHTEPLGFETLDKIFEMGLVAELKPYMKPFYHVKDLNGNKEIADTKTLEMYFRLRSIDELKDTTRQYYSMSRSVRSLFTNLDCCTKDYIRIIYLYRKFLEYGIIKCSIKDLIDNSYDFSDDINSNEQMALHYVVGAYKKMYPEYLESI